VPQSLLWKEKILFPTAIYSTMYVNCKRESTMIDHERPEHAFSAGLVKHLHLWVSVVAVVALLLPIGNAAQSDEGDNGKGAVTLVKVIPVPVTLANNTAGALYSFDISWVDQATQTFYVADRSNRVVDIVDAKTKTFKGQLAASPPFAGISPPAFSTATAGPDGVVTGGHCLFVTDAPSRVVSFDTTTFLPTQVSDVKTAFPSANRADELAYDPKDKKLLVINNADTPPFGTLITVNPATCALTHPSAADGIPLDKAHGVDATNGAEQPVFHPGTGKFYLSIPQIGPNAKDGGVIRIDPTTGAIEHTFPIEFCMPAGLTVGPGNEVLIGCNAVFDTAGSLWDPNGAVTAAPKDVILNVKTGATKDVLGVGAGDEVWFNEGDGNYYTTGSGSPFRPLPAATAKGATPMGVIDADSGKVLQSLTTYNVPALLTGPAAGQHPAGTAHSVAANAENNLVFVPLAANNAFSAFAVPNGGPVPDCEKGCIAVYGHAGKGEGEGDD
jgi:hypothetical protein